VLDSELDARLRKAGEQWRSGQPSLGQPMEGPENTAATVQPSRLRIDRRRRRLAIAAVAVIGSVGFVVAKPDAGTVARPATPLALASTSQVGSSGLLPVNNTTSPSGTGPFFRPAGYLTGPLSEAPAVARGRGGYIVVELLTGGSCPGDPIGFRVRQSGPQRIEIIPRLDTAKLGRCVEVLLPHYTTLPLPAGVDEQQELWVTIALSIGTFTIDLPRSPSSGDDSTTGP
jgi:hypothetical protein